MKPNYVLNLERVLSTGKYCQTAKTWVLPKYVWIRFSSDNERSTDAELEGNVRINYMREHFAHY